MDISTQRQEVAEAVTAYGYAVVCADGYAVGHDPAYVVAGLDDDVNAGILNRVVRGEDVFQGVYDVKLVVADPATVELPFASDYHTTGMYQVLWPDALGFYPDEDDYAGTGQVLYTEVANRN
jgi:hypothetical protein